MPTLFSAEFGTLSYEEPDVYHFRNGLPAFEECRRFLLLHREEYGPFFVLHCVDQPGLRFACLPVDRLTGDFDLQPAGEELVSAGLAPETGDLLCLAIVTFRPGRPATANLLAPVVLSPSRRLGLQVILSHGGYSHQVPLLPPEAEEAPAC